MNNIDKYVERLKQEKEGLVQELADLRSEDPSQSGFRDINNTEDEDAAESELHDRIQAQIEARESHLERVEKALAKADAGTYGICERCGKEIPKARLEAMPWAIYDVECEAIIESGRS